MVTRNVTFYVLAVSIFLTPFVSAEAAQKTKKKRASQGQVVMKPGVIKQNLSTDIRFDDMSLRGKRQTPLGLQIVAEAEKDVPSLVDFRKDFKDRAGHSLSRR